MMNGQAYDRKEALSRTEALIGSRALAILQESTVAVFGLGGVGSWCAEALARSGVGALTLIDHDEVGLTNLNRQLGIPQTLPNIQPGDIPRMARHAAREANPLYPVPKLMTARELETFYRQVSDRRKA